MTTTYAHHMGGGKFRLICEDCENCRHDMEIFVATEDEKQEVIAAATDFIWENGRCQDCGAELDPYLSIPRLEVEDLLVYRPEKLDDLNGWAHILDILPDFEGMTDEAIAQWLEAQEFDEITIQPSATFIYLDALATVVSICKKLPLREDLQRSCDVADFCLVELLTQIEKRNSPITKIMSGGVERNRRIREILLGENNA
ncbi:MAG: hypothetical protein HC799_16230 [Limnothrix sp. RL_2_0]|nr:hypothetical protein [Limnothrix sp. RL_2_0]